MDRDEIRSRLSAALDSEEDLVWACLFGSAARAERFEDVDVAIMPRRDRWRSLLDTGRLVSRLSEALGVEVDVVDLRDAPPLFVGPMLRERIVVLDRDPAARAAWEAETASRAIDFRLAFDRAEAIRYEALRRRRAG